MRRPELVLSLALVGSVATSSWLWSELQAERASNAKLSARLNAQSTESIAASASVAASPPLPASSPEPAVSSPASAEPVPAESSRTVQGSEDEWDTYQRRLLQDPRYREAWRQQERLSYAPRRENLISLLGFTPEQADAVIDLSIDSHLAAIEHPQTEELPQDRVKELEAAEEQRQQARLLTLLGEEKRAQLAVYMASRGSRMQVDRLRTQMTGNDALRDDQVEPLILALHAEQAQMRQTLSDYRDSHGVDGSPDGWRQFSELQIKEMKAAHARMHSAAAPILSRSQLGRLDAMLKRDLERTEAEHRLTRLQVGNRASNDN